MKKLFTYTKVTMAVLVLTALAVILCVGTTAAEASAPDMDIAYCNLSFENDTHIVYAVRSNDANIKLLVWTEPQEQYLLGTQKALLSPLAGQMTIKEELYTAFKYTGVAAKQMTDNVYVRTCIDNGNGDVVYGNVHKYSILQYAYNMTGKTGQAAPDAKLIKMLSDMLTYGASAQEYYGYHTERLATDEFVGIELTHGWLPDGFAQGLYRVGETVTITAPAQNEEGVAFAQWKDESGNVIASTAEYALTVGAVNHIYTPEYIAYSAGLEFESNGDGTCYLIGIGECTDTEIKIPAQSPNGDAVIGIDRNAFSGEAITSVSIPKSVEEIGRNAFSNCTSLTDVYYSGSEAEWSLVAIGTGNTPLENATMHYAVVEVFTVAFVDHDGSILKTETVNKGAAATAPAAPARDGYTFTGWDVAFDNVTENLTVTALYSLAVTEPTFVVSDAIASAGDTNVEITVALKNNPGVTSMLMKIAFDNSALELVSMSYNTEIGGQGIPNASSESPITAYWAEGFTDVTGDWIFLTLVFNVSSAAAAGDYEIAVSYNADDVFNAAETNVAFDIINGKITVS